MNDPIQGLWPPLVGQVRTHGVPYLITRIYEQLNASSDYSVNVIQLPPGEAWATTTLPEPQWSDEEDDLSVNVVGTQSPL